MLWHVLYTNCTCAHMCKYDCDSLNQHIMYAYRSKVSKFANGFEVHSIYQTTDPTAAQAAPGKQVFVKYRGTLENGKV